ncbi:MAG: uroporphyrinogen-III synthase [Gammaproteobacteria bacterium]|nr:uroporphyrinogen-III synthase [Gammaproteobacteria bacterium]
MMNAAMKTILVTRPGLPGTELCRLLDKEGSHSFHFPTIAFAPPQNTEAVSQAITIIDKQHWLIFNSPQAVHAITPAIKAAWPQFPSQIKIAAIGAGTKKALLAAGHQTVFQPAEWSSEGLLSSPEFQSVHAQRIAIVRGEGGRELLDIRLRERGAQVLSILAYQRVLPQQETEHCENLLKKKAIHAIVCTSYESVRNFKDLLSAPAWNSLKMLPLVVVSQRVKTLAQDLGFQTIWVAHNPSHEAILAILKEIVV